MKRAEQIRNIGIIGAPDAGMSEVYDAILRTGIQPAAPEGAAIPDGLTDWGEYGDNPPKPYDAKKRGKLFKGNK